LTKFRSTKKIPLANFPSRPLKNAWIKSAFPYALSPYHKGAKRNIIGVVKGANVKLSHCTCFALIYPMENEMPLVHHVIEQWGCGYINEDGKGPNERTQWHPMLKPKSKLM
jgi:hypothetical protein